MKAGLGRARRDILSGFGQVARAADGAQLAALTALSGSGAAYPALMARALMDFARTHRLAEDIARAALENVLVVGGAHTAGQTDKGAALVETDKYCKGTTAAGTGSGRGPWPCRSARGWPGGFHGKADERLI